MTLQDYLDEMNIAYRLSSHGTAYTSQDLAAREHVPGKQVIKPVVVEIDGKDYLCALPATFRIDLQRLREHLHAHQVALVDENRLREIFPDCEVGAEPPIGKMYGMPTLMDESLFNDEQVTFQAGSHTTAVTMTLRDFQRAAQPEVVDFGQHV
jgi:Ala-tRNA(Pro) deacylase